MRRLVLALLVACAAAASALEGRGQAPTVTIVAVTHTQAVVSYTPPDAASCRLEVSESATFTPLVHDVNPTLFPGSDLDNRPGNLLSGASRTFVVGKFGMTVPSGTANVFLGADGIVYSRSLAASTTYFYRLTCGVGRDSIAAGSFATANVPLGLTWQPSLPVAAPGAYNFPSWPVSRTAPNAVIVDPVSGVKLRPVWMPSDTASRPTWESSALHLTCAPVPYQGGRLCVQPIQGSGRGAMYWVHPTQPAKFLGRLSFAGSWCGPNPCQGTYAKYWSGDADIAWSTTEWNAWYDVVTTHWHPSGACTEDPSSGTGCRHALAKFTFAGGLADAAQDADAQVTQSLLQVPWSGQDDSVEGGWRLLDARYASSKLGGPGVVINGVGANSSTLVLLSRSYNQNSYGMFSAWDVSQSPARVIGSADVGRSPGSRWCGVHAHMNVWDSNPPVAAFRPTSMEYPGDSGPWGVRVWGDSAHVSSLGATATDVYTSGEPSCYSGTTSNCTGTTGATDTSLQNAAPGDLVKLPTGGEIVKIAAKVSASHWVVERGWGGTASIQPAGGQGQMFCEQWEPKEQYFKMGYWSYTTDSLGANIRYDASGAAAGHMEARPSGRLSEGWRFVSGLSDSLSATSPTRTLDRAPGFAGQPAWSPTNGYTVWSNSEAPGTAGRWFVDNAKFTGGSSQVSDGRAATLVAGYANVWRFYPNPQYPLSKHYAHLGFVDRTPLAEKSGPAMRLTDADLNTFCIAYRAGECVGGSEAGNVYIVSARNPAVDEMRCLGSYNNNSYGMCVANVTATINSVVQVGVDSTATCTGVPEVCGADRLRIVQSLTQPYAFGTLYTGVKPWTDGSAIASYGTWGTSVDESRLVLAVPPPYPLPDAQNPSYASYVPTGLSVRDVSSTYPSVDNVVVQFGYAENGAASAFYCTPRAEACVKGAQADGDFGFASDTVSGVSCAHGCTVSLPVLPRRIAYYQVLYRDRANNVLGRSSVALTADSPTVGTNGLPPVPPSGVRIR